MRLIPVRRPRREVTLGDMSSQERSRDGMILTTVALLGGSLIALRAGGFILFDDTTGFGVDRSGPLLGVALLLAVGAFVTGLQHPIARRSLGGALALLDVAIVAIAASDNGFRFFWTTYEGELLQFQVVLGVVALVLLTPSFLSPPTSSEPAGTGQPIVRNRRALTAWARVGLYLCALTIGMFIAFVIGVTHFEATQCSGLDFDGECDLSPFEGLLWSAGTLLFGLIAIVVTEVNLAPRRRATRERLTSGRD